MAGYSKNTISKIIVDEALYAANAKNASVAEISISSSFAITASYALNATSGSSPAFPYTGSAEITGSLILTGSFYLDQSLTYFSSISTVPGANILFFLETGSYRSAFGKYTLYSSSNARAGEFITVWNGSSITYFDNSTSDIGNTSDLGFRAILVGNQVRIESTTTQNNWIVKMLTTFI